MTPDPVMQALAPTSWTAIVGGIMWWDDDTSSLIFKRLP